MVIEVERYLVAYMTLGFPNEGMFSKFLELVNDSGVNFIEIGIPPKFAKYDGPIIRKSYEHVKKMLGNDNYLPLIKRTREILSIPIIALTYMDDHINNLRQFMENIYSLGIDSLLLPDLLIDYIDIYEEVIEMAKSVGLGLTLFSSPSMPDKLIERASIYSRFFLYYGIRPSTGIPIPIDPDKLVKRVRTVIKNKLVVGFGLSINDIPRVIKAGADGIAIGSMLIDSIEKNGIEESIKIIKMIRGVIDGI